MRKILWSWDTRNPLLALAIMAGLLWIFLNAAHFGVLVTSERVREWEAALDREVTLELEDGSRLQARLDRSDWCFRGGLICWCLAFRQSNEGPVHEFAFFAWELPRVAVEGN